jgi:SAM-dependent methyltransferase
MSVASDYIQHWDDKFSTRAWGRYPPEDLVRFMGRQFAGRDRTAVSVLEVGCGPGANLWFLHREGYKVSGIDGSPAAIRIAEERLATENKGLNKHAPDLRVGNFATLPWADSQFDVVLDIFAIYANTLPVIDQVVSEVYRVLKPGGLFYSKLWGRNCTGYGQGREIEPGTYDDIPAGPCQDMGVSHFFDRAEIDRVFSRFSVRTVDVLTRTESVKNLVTEEYLCQFERRS